MTVQRKRKGCARSVKKETKCLRKLPWAMSTSAHMGVEGTYDIIGM